LLRVSGWQPPKKEQPAKNVTLTVASHDRLPEDTPNDARSLVDQLLIQGRSALLLRPEIVANLTEDQQRRAYEALYDDMSLVPDGEVYIIGGLVFPNDDPDDEEETTTQGTVVRVERFFIDRYQVTNEQFKQFVDAGGYEQMAIWDPEIWPGVMVGVSWYEASAYARWVGKRLLTDPEWEKAASWPTQLSANKRPGRKYPWGEIMDRGRCNLWGTGPNSTASVYDFEDGVSVGGAYQLIGNVWEWTTANFGAWCCPSQDVILPSPMKSVRGGAFDTYFDNQATCQFRSGEDPVSRKHNVGFRCALSLCDLALTQAAASKDSEADSQPTSSAGNSESDSELSLRAVDTEEAVLS
jgi:iron(II)-dependent oxidoreductase